MENDTADEIGVVEICPVDTTLSVIGGRWKPLILFHLRAGPV